MYVSLLSPSDNYIDGAALVTLPDDFQEFQHLVPQSGLRRLRMKLKEIIQMYSSGLSLGVMVSHPYTKSLLYLHSITKI